MCLHHFCLLKFEDYYEMLLRYDEYDEEGEENEEA